MHSLQALFSSMRAHGPVLDQALNQAADTFDRLPALRQLLRHHAGGTINA